MSTQDSSIDDRPTFSWPDVAASVAARFGEFEFVRKLPSERDLNFLVRPLVAVNGSDGVADEADMVVFKVHNPNDSWDFVECQSLAMERASSSGASCQRLLRTLGPEREAIVSLPIPGRELSVEGIAPRCLCRALSFLPGRMLAEAAAEAADNVSLWRYVGEAVGSVTAALLDFQHEAAKREFAWDLQRCDRVVASHLADVEESRRPLLQRVLEKQRQELEPLLPRLRRSVVHNDPNDYNLVVGREGVGVLDFGDMLYSYTCSDAAICMAYLLFHCPEGSSLAESLVPFVESFNRRCALEEAEFEALFGLAVMRVCTSVSMSAYQSRLDPGNEYLLISSKPAWRLLERLEEFDNSTQPAVLFKAACGFQV
ncbi:unnamed protein product [Polarella glacialis]|uniref:Hydroxylysine kinase n=1 Tax=Polarella glacialis TaxID=89957 RepID=A0A813GU73_POLGL|nr:unnamed protein product [Polarella glacialis]CAE8724031.1 unnamed protein product [Polarella glacialis]